MGRKGDLITLQQLFELRVKYFWQYFRTESFAFWMICAYLFLEYFRPQSIYPQLAFLPWTQLAVLGAFVGCFSDKSVRWVKSPINAGMLIFLLVILASSLLAYWPAISHQNLENFYTWFVIYFLIINIVNSERRLFIFVCIFLLASFKLSLSLSLTWAKRGFAFTDWGLKGPPGFFENSGELAIQMLVFWPVALAFAFCLRPYVSRLKYYILLLMPITAVMVILGASSRGAQLALLVQLIVLNYRSIFKPKVLLACAVILSVLWAVLPEEQKDRFRVVGDDRTSQQRLLYWENGLEMINDHPILGVGYFNFIPYYERFYREDMLYGSAELPHNILVQVGTDTGYLGVLVFMSLILVALRKMKALSKVSVGFKDRIYLSPSGLNLSLIGFFFAGQFVTVAYYPFLWIHLAFVVVSYNIYCGKAGR